MNIRYHVELSESERGELGAVVGGGKHYARKIKPANILLADDSGLSDDDIGAAVAVGGWTVYRIKRRYVEVDLEAVLNEEPTGKRLSQAEQQRRSLNRRHRLFEPARRPRPLDAAAAGWRNGQAERL